MECFPEENGKCDENSDHETDDYQADDEDYLEDENVPRKLLVLTDQTLRFV
jgi:hypothetical protein